MRIRTGNTLLSSKLLTGSFLTQNFETIKNQGHKWRQRKITHERWLSRNKQLVSPARRLILRVQSLFFKKGFTGVTYFWSCEKICGMPFSFDKEEDKLIFSRSRHMYMLTVGYLYFFKQPAKTVTKTWMHYVTFFWNLFSFTTILQFNYCTMLHHVSVHVYKGLLELARSSGTGKPKSDEQACHVSGRCIDSFKILSHITGWNNYKPWHVFLRSFLLLRAANQLIRCLEISGNKNNLRTILGWNCKKLELRTAQPQPKVIGTCSYGLLVLDGCRLTYTRFLRLLGWQTKLFGVPASSIWAWLNQLCPFAGELGLGPFPFGQISGLWLLKFPMSNGTDFSSRCIKELQIDWSIRSHDLGIGWRECALEGSAEFETESV